MPPRSPSASRRSSSLPRIHSVIRPTTGSSVGPNSVELASGRPASERQASITAICMPKQMPKYGTLRSRANFGGEDLALRAARAEAARHQNAMHVFEMRRRDRPLSKISLSIQSSLTRTRLAMPPWVSASISDL